MRSCLIQDRPEGAVPLVPVIEGDYAAWLTAQPEPRRRWLDACGFRGKANSFCPLPGQDAALGAVVVGVGDAEDPFALGALPAALPPGDYYLDAGWTSRQREQAALGWGLGAYRFERYKKSDRSPARLALGPDSDARPLQEQLHALYLVRDLINTPAEDMMPEDLADTLLALASDFDARVSQWVGKELLEEDYPAIHAVGRASQHAPRLLDLTWGEADHPRLTLVGKGVCFDSGGLDLKNASGMRLMKKDMGGAAHVMGLARMIMSARLPVRLRVLVPAVENAVSGNAFRPGDVLRSRKGLSIEIDNTDAEGRLILCDALAEAMADKPDLVLDFATLTGAARVALGTEVPALFCNDDALADGLLRAAEMARDPVWRLPLHAPYRDLIDSKIADIVNSAGSPFGGAITAALFLQAFVEPQVPWAHFDIMAWNSRARPGRPEGGEAMGLRAVFQYLQQRYPG